jgi:hypothetical protein
VTVCEAPYEFGRVQLLVAEALYVAPESVDPQVIRYSRFARTIPEPTALQVYVTLEAGASVEALGLDESTSQRFALVLTTHAGSLFGPVSDPLQSGGGGGGVQVGLTGSVHPGLHSGEVFPVEQT